MVFLRTPALTHMLIGSGFILQPCNSNTCRWGGFDYCITVQMNLSSVRALFNCSESWIWFSILTKTSIKYQTTSRSVPFPLKVFILYLLCKSSGIRLSCWHFFLCFPQFIEICSFIHGYTIVPVTSVGATVYKRATNRRPREEQQNKYRPFTRGKAMLLQA